MTTGYRLSHRQQSLLRSAGGVLLRPVTITISVVAPVDPARLHEAVLAVVARHEVLRTRFHGLSATAAPIQAISAEPDVEWRVLGPIDEPDSSVDELIEQMINRRYGLDGEATVGATLLTGTGGSGLLVLAMSALAVDTGSAAALVADLRQAYRGQTLDDDVVQYAQFAEWQHDHLDEPAEGAASDYWRHVLDEAVPAPALPLAQRSRVGQPGTRRRALGSELDQAIRVLATEHRTSPETVVFAGWAAVLLRLTRQQRLTVWRTLDGRADEDLRTAVGPFAATVPSTFTVRPHTRFADVLAQAEHTTAENERWLDWLGPEPLAGIDGGYGFDVIDPPTPGDGLVVTQVTALSMPFPIALRVFRAGPAHIELRHGPELRGQDADVVLEQVIDLLTAACADPARQLRHLPLLTAAERTRMASANQTEASSRVLFHRAFTGQALVTPDRLAVSSGDHALSYAELDRRSNRIAAVLRERGVGRGSVCAFWHRNGIPVLEGLLGILKAGAAYLVLDPQWPYDRIAAVLRDCVPALLLTESSLVPDPAASPLPVLRLDSDADIIAAASDEPAETVVELDDLAYVIYTSGSTGTPKGVCVTHAGLANYLGWAARIYPAPEDQVSIVHATPVYDMMLTPLFAPLLRGGCVRFTSMEGLDGIIRTLDEGTGMGLLKLTPTHLRLLRQLLSEDQLGKLAHTMVLGGEGLYEDVIEPWRLAEPTVAMFNEYGPTETVVGCAVYDCAALSGSDAVPIGKPIAGTRLYVLDETMSMLPMGVPGELYVGGAGIARGYHRRPDLTAERFVPDPFGADPGARLYRTGDVARYLPSGDLEYFGRVDDQQQVNGFRVEPAEIEVALESHHAVKSAAVGVRRSYTDLASLVACVVPEGRAPHPEELRRHLRDRLPQQMIPSTLVTVGELPLTPSGKLDRNRVPELVEAHRPRRSVPLPPRTEVEQVVLRVWQEVLGNPWVDLDSNFFDAGGTSFLLLDVAVRLETELGIEVAILTLLEHPTVASSAQVIAVTDEPAPDEPAPAQEDGDRAVRQREAIARMRQQRAGRGGA